MIQSTKITYIEYPRPEKAIHVEATSPKVEIQLISSYPLPKAIMYVLAREIEWWVYGYMESDNKRKGHNLVVVRHRENRKRHYRAFNSQSLRAERNRDRNREKGKKKNTKGWKRDRWREEEKGKRRDGPNQCERQHQRKSNPVESKP